jgi:hypothetical protein
MQFAAREMTLEETYLVIEYFHSSSPEHLELLGVDPTRLPSKAAWADRFRQIFAMPIETHPRILCDLAQ